MSFLRSKHSGWTHEGKRTPFFGGGGGGGPTQSTGTTYNTNIPEYARPYVETMLGATQKQLFNMDGNEITGFKPYQPYSKDMGDYVAPFSPLQQQAMQATGQLQTPGQIGQASGLAGMAGLGSLGAANQAMGIGGQYQQMAQDPNSIKGYMSPYMQNVVDYQKTQALRDYGIGQGLRKAQSVGQNAFGGNRQALMESEAQRALGSQIGGIEAQGAQNAFQAAQQAQQFGTTMGLQGLQTGLQGYGQMGQAASTLGGLGAQQLGAQKDIIGMQTQLGAQQQAAEQQKINQAIQDWANTQQYPLMQLGVMSNMLRGLPMQSATTNQYVAAPNPLTQGIGLAGAGASIYNALGGGKKAGGVVGMKAGGIAGYNIGGEAKSDLYDMPLNRLQKEAEESPSESIRNMAKSIIKERTGKAGGGIIAFQNRGLVPEVDKEEQQRAEDKKAIERGLSEAKAGWESTKAAARDVLTLPGRGIAGAFESAVTRPARAMGVDIPYLPSSFYGGDASSLTPHMDALTRQRMAASNTPTSVPQSSVSQGDVANREDYRSAPSGTTETKGVQFDPTAGGNPAVANLKNAPAGGTSTGTGLKSTGALMPTAGIKFPTAPTEETAAQLARGAEERVAAYGANEANQKARSELQAERANAADEARRATALRMAEFFGAWGSTPGNTIVAGLNALKNKVPDFITDMKEEAKIRKAINKDIAELDKLDREEKNGIKKDYFAERSKLAERAMHKYGYELTAATHVYSADQQLKAAQARSGGAGDTSYFKALANEGRISKEIAEARKSKDYQRNATLAQHGSGKAKEDAAAWIESKETEFNNKIKNAKDITKQFDKAGRTEAGADIPEEPKTTAAPAGPAKLIKNKDGTYTYQR